MAFFPFRIIIHILQLGYIYTARSVHPSGTRPRYAGVNRLNLGQSSGTFHDSDCCPASPNVGLPIIHLMLVRRVVAASALVTARHLFLIIALLFSIQISPLPVQPSLNLRGSLPFHVSTPGGLQSLIPSSFGSTAQDTSNHSQASQTIPLSQLTLSAPEAP
jgi:hypothetical protein